MTEIQVLQNRRRPRPVLSWRAMVPAAVTCLLLVGILGDRLLWRQPSAEAAPYHARVQSAAAGIPLHFDDWLGEDVPVPQGAVSLLKPNVLVTRRYRQMSTGRSVNVLLVQCTDAGDLLDHYPPNCYPRQGWQLVTAEPRDWRAGERLIRGMRYTFRTDAGLLGSETTVDNFMILPGGDTARDMDQVHRAAQDRRRKHFGAAQVQVVYGSNFDEAERTRVLQTFVARLSSTMQVIESDAGVQ